MKRFFRSKDGAIAVYAAFVAALVIGAGVLAFDFGKAAVLKAQMQNAADSMVMSAATELDALTDSRERATAVIEDTLVHGSYIPDSSGAFAVDNIRFYAIYDRSAAFSGDSGYCTTTGDGTAMANSCVTVEVADSWAAGGGAVTGVGVYLIAEDVSIILKPIVDLISNTTSAVNAFRVNAFAVAEKNDIACDLSPFFVCNPNDPATPNAAYDLQNSSVTGGKQMVIKSGAGNTNPDTPGNFGLLCGLMGAGGECEQSGANQVNATLVAAESPLCSTGEGVETQTGVAQNKTVRGVNIRFDESNPGGDNGPRASNIMGFYKDSDVDDIDESADTQPMGNGDWNADTYWTEEHASDGNPPAVFDTNGDLAVDTDVSRYQMYLWEKGLDFCRDGGATHYDYTSSTIAGWDCYTAGVAENENALDTSAPDTDLADNHPSSFSNSSVTNDSQRRIFTVAVINCDTLENAGTPISGNSSQVPVNGGFVDFFSTECSCSGGGGSVGCNNQASSSNTCMARANGDPSKDSENGNVYAEIVGPNSSGVGAGKVITNIRLVH